MAASKAPARARAHGAATVDCDPSRRCLARPASTDRRRIKQLAGYDDRFCRMWEFYLAGCEVAFHYMNRMVF